MPHSSPAVGWSCKGKAKPCSYILWMPLIIHILFSIMAQSQIFGEARAARVCSVNCLGSCHTYLVIKPCNHSKCFPICVAYLCLRTLYALIRFTYKFTKPLKHLFLSALDCSIPHFESWHILIVGDGRQIVKLACISCIL